ncbi:conserved hypothetical protein [Clostridium neonatale]|mgnify:FL=1|uniref:HK97 gp10 family phage protein n=1 Tax=Clostridium neonatale TaxID=137838 RepID=UPI00291B41E0|nr:HK97 gp10 family phage protein [Clostridium neonatale]CAI3699786.1 conserved hypothetical protein [Clostridium neonatale]
MANIDTSDIDDWAKTLLGYANSDMPKKSKKFMQNEGNKLKKRTLAEAKSLTKKKTGNYYKGIKRGKVYHYRDKNNNSVRVYGGSPHAHLIEYGHRQIVDGKEVGFVEGKHVFEKAKNEFESEFNSDCEDFAEDILKELSK